jgi:hypothetical protein
MSATPPLVVFLRSGGWEARWLAASAALSAAALGREVTLALFEEPLRAFVDGRFDEGAPAPAAGLGATRLREALLEARAVLPLRIVACDTALRLAGLDPAAVVPPLDGVVPLTALVRDAGTGALTF